MIIQYLIFLIFILYFYYIIKLIKLTKLFFFTNINVPSIFFFQFKKIVRHMTWRGADLVLTKVGNEIHNCSLIRQHSDAD